MKLSFTRHSLMDWTRVVWIIVDFCDVFIICLDSDGTHSLQRIHRWASDVMIYFSKSVLMKKQTHLQYILNSLRVSQFQPDLTAIRTYLYKVSNLYEFVRPLSYKFIWFLLNRTLPIHKNLYEWPTPCQTCVLCVLCFPSSRAHSWSVPVPVLLCNYQFPALCL